SKVCLNISGRSVNKISIPSSIISFCTFESSRSEPTIATGFPALGIVSTKCLFNIDRVCGPRNKASMSCSYE
ncbi:unnamed protein product, partial [Rotaria sp. Silwood1]